MRPLGRVQKDVLRGLKEHGQWTRGCGWVWDTPSNTQRILESLVRRGLVEKVIVWSGYERGDSILRSKTTYRPIGEDNERD